MENQNTFIEIIELILTQNASTKTILEQLALMRELRQSKQLTESQIKLEATKLHLEAVEEACKRNRGAK